jgi:hypothetical protein
MTLGAGEPTTLTTYYWDNGWVRLAAIDGSFPPAALRTDSRPPRSGLIPGRRGRQLPMPSIHNKAIPQVTPWSDCPAGADPRCYHIRGTVPCELSVGRTARCPGLLLNRKEEETVSTTTLLIIIVIVLVLGGGGWGWSRRGR